MVNKGDCLEVETKTQDDVFGKCVYQVVETDIQAPEKDRKDKHDGVKCVMLCGTGPSAHPGFKVHDSQQNIEKDISEGKTRIVSEEYARDLMDKTEAQKQGGGNPGTGVMEV